MEGDQELQADEKEHELRTGSLPYSFAHACESIPALEGGRQVADCADACMRISLPQRCWPGSTACRTRRKSPAAAVAAIGTGRGGVGRRGESAAATGSGTGSGAGTGTGIETGARESADGKAQSRAGNGSGKAAGPTATMRALATATPRARAALPRVLGTGRVQSAVRKFSPRVSSALSATRQSPARPSLREATVRATPG
jgi:hypothetical protein